MTAITLRCSCCGLPWAKLIGDVLEVQSRHNGSVHVNRISVQTLVEVALFVEPDAEEMAGPLEEAAHDYD